MPISRIRCRVIGVVQGVGFRPFVWKLATGWGLTGFVLNDTGGVTLEVQGANEDLQRFASALIADAPPLARIDKVITTSVACLDHETRFDVRMSRPLLGSITYVAPEAATCQDCLHELLEPSDRRFRYPFINCTNCGPRYTLICDLPYDRDQTTMRLFAMCDPCKSEYEDPGSRRFHAEPIACETCGPKLWYVASRDPNPMVDCPSALTGEAAIRATREAIAGGAIVAIKGIGGFHLACDATQSQAVRRLRERKQRSQKPFAVMVVDLEVAKRLADLDLDESMLLQSSERPIVLLRKKDSTKLCMEVAPDNDFLGVMLGYAPLHHLLLDRKDCWVMTSGNVSEEPIEYTNAGAWTRLQPLADGFLFHDRDVVTPCDDSVVRKLDLRLLPIRRSRGYAPLPIELPSPGRAVLAVGGELKTTLGLSIGQTAILSQHLGDMGNRETLHGLERCFEHLSRLYRFNPECVAVDLHPGYLGSDWGRKLGDRLRVPVVPIQHHHAHVAALLTEHRHDGPLIGCCFDGTGFGLDGAIWGGEWIIPTADSYERMAHLRYVPLPGGDACIRHPARIALAHLFSAGLEWDPILPPVSEFSKSELRNLQLQIERGLYCVPTSSMGRLFDAVASLCGVRHRIDYEGQAAMEWEALAWKAWRKSTQTNPAFPYRIVPGSPLVVDPGPLFQSIKEELDRGTKPDTIAITFHQTVAEFTREVCDRIRSLTGIATVGLTGGVFQNTLLTRLTKDRLIEAQFEVLVHEKVPPNDGGLALGQIAIARNDPSIP